MKQENRNTGDCARFFVLQKQIIINHNIMEEQTQAPVEEGMELHPTGCECGSEECSTQLKEREYEQSSLAVLLALIPLLVFTFMGQVGLF
jgi:hypothetical protein